MKSENRVRLLQAIRKGMAWMEELVGCPSLNTEALAQREGCSERAVRMSISLAFLAPEIMRAAVDGRLPRGLGLGPADRTARQLGRAASVTRSQLSFRTVSPVLFEPVSRTLGV